MASQSPKFSLNDLVWAKMRGHPAWPAKVVKHPKGTQGLSNKVYVFFYGTHQNAWMSPSDLFPYLEHKGSLYKPIGRKGYQEAVWEIEEDPQLEITSSVKTPKPLPKKPKAAKAQPVTTKDKTPPPAAKSSRKRKTSGALDKPPSPTQAISIKRERLEPAESEDPLSINECTAKPDSEAKHGYSTRRKHNSLEQLQQNYSARKEQLPLSSPVKGTFEGKIPTAATPGKGKTPTSSISDRDKTPAKGKNPTSTTPGKGKIQSKLPMEWRTPGKSPLEKPAKSKPPLETEIPKEKAKKLQDSKPARDRKGKSSNESKSSHKIKSVPEGKPPKPSKAADNQINTRPTRRSTRRQHSTEPSSSESVIDSVTDNSSQETGTTADTKLSQNTATDISGGLIQELWDQAKTESHSPIQEAAQSENTDIINTDAPMPQVQGNCSHSESQPSSQEVIEISISSAQEASDKTPVSSEPVTRSSSRLRAKVEAVSKDSSQELDSGTDTESQPSVVRDITEEKSLETDSICLPTEASEEKLVASQASDSNALESVTEEIASMESTESVSIAMETVIGESVAVETISVAMEIDATDTMKSADSESPTLNSNVEEPIAMEISSDDIIIEQKEFSTENHQIIDIAKAIEISSSEDNNSNENAVETQDSQQLKASEPMEISLPQANEPLPASENSATLPEVPNTTSPIKSTETDPSNDGNKENTAKKIQPKEAPKFSPKNLRHKRRIKNVSEDKDESPFEKYKVSEPNTGKEPSDTSTDRQGRKRKHSESLTENGEDEVGSKRAGKETDKGEKVANNFEELKKSWLNSDRDTPVVMAGDSEGELPSYIMLKSGLTPVEVLRIFNYNLKASLIEGNPDILKAVSVLHDINDFYCSSADVDKVPDLVATIKRVKRFRKSVEVMKAAEEVFDKLKTLYLYPEDAPPRPIERARKLPRPSKKPSIMDDYLRSQRNANRSGPNSGITDVINNPPSARLMKINNTPTVPEKPVEQAKQDQTLSNTDNQAKSEPQLRRSSRRGATRNGCDPTTGEGETDQTVPC